MRFSSNRSKTLVIQRSPNHTRGRTPCAFISAGRVSVAWVNSAMRVSRHSSRPRKYGEFAPRATCDGGQALRGVPGRGELIRADLQVELHARARRLRCDRVGVRLQRLLRPADVDVQVLAARQEQLLVEQRVARVGADRLGGHVLGAQRRQDADHHHAGALLVGPGVAVVELLAHLLLVLAGAVAHEALRRDVDLEVEPPELLDERRARRCWPAPRSCAWPGCPRRRSG